MHYIAGLVEDMEMPPEGKAPALSRDEIALVRGWIDQGRIGRHRRPLLPWSLTCAGSRLMATPQFFASIRA